MKIIEWVLLAGVGAALLWMLVGMLRRGNVVKTWMLSAVIGVGSLLVIAGIGTLTTPMLNVNGYTLASSAVLGVPGVIVMMIVKILWGI